MLSNNAAKMMMQCVGLGNKRSKEKMIKQVLRDIELDSSLPDAFKEVSDYLAYLIARYNDLFSECSLVINKTDSPNKVRVCVWFETNDQRLEFNLITKDDTNL